ncbi:MAG: Stp1/IreP family PP2C-type Ser/Thr phosphatase [Candidatus Aminicenantes bacterium]|jgi:protein phosphatase
MHIEVFGHTDIGKKRTNNEDSYLCHPIKDTKTPRFLLAVADGMGGHTGGEIASELAIETIKETIHTRFENHIISPSDYLELLENSVQKANINIFRRASEDEDLMGMGSTLVAALVSDKKVYITNIGDSRAYLIRKKQIQQITVDHNWKSEQIQKGQLAEEDIRNSPYKDLITRSLGLNENADIDTFTIETQPEDFLLLCSDGLYSLLSKKDILKAFRKSKNLKKTCHRLVDTANKKGGHDNITVVIAHFTKDDTARRSVADTVRIDFSKV